MVFEQSWRWYGPDDPVSLNDIKQAGANGIVTALHHIPVGKVWTVEEIKKRINMLEESNKIYAFPLNWNVVESLPVHEHIKQGRSERKELIENYKESLHNLSRCGINRVCYNFMPVLDWLRTNVGYRMPDGSKALQYDYLDLIIFDIHILKRKEAALTYEGDLIKKAEEKYLNMTSEDLKVLKESVLMALPGNKKGFTLKKLRQGLNDYKSISREQLRDNLIYFLKEVIPVAEDLGIKMAIHPDDPPWSVLGLPRVVSKISDLEIIFNEIPLQANGLTFCSGSLGALGENDLEKIINKYYERIHFVHLRSVERKNTFQFYEANHLEGSVDMVKLIRIFYENQNKFNTPPLPMRPDHGHEMMGDQKISYYPGYSAIGRLRGLAELRGVELGVIKTLEK